MGFRFRKSVKLAPGVRLNISKTGVGMSVGGKGARVSVHSSGRTTSTVGIPGTGLSYQSVSSRKKGAKAASPHGATRNPIDFDFSEPSSPELITVLSDDAFFTYMDGYIQYCQDALTPETVKRDADIMEEHLAFLRQEADRRKSSIISKQKAILKKKAKLKVPCAVVALLYVILAILLFFTGSTPLGIICIIVACLFALWALKASDAGDALNELETGTEQE